MAMDWEATSGAGGGADGVGIDLDEDRGRRGLLALLSSVQRRADDATGQLTQLAHLRDQKGRLLGDGAAVLRHHCAASWPEAGGDGVTARATAAASGAGWQVAVRLTGPAAALLDGSEVCVAATAAWCRASCDQQRSRVETADGAHPDSVTVVATARLTLADHEADSPTAWPPLHVHALLRRGGAWRRAVPAGAVHLRAGDWLRAMRELPPPLGEAARPHAAWVSVQCAVGSELDAVLREFRGQVQGPTGLRPLHRSASDAASDAERHVEEAFELGAAARLCVRRFTEFRGDQAFLCLHAADRPLLSLLRSRLEPAVLAAAQEAGLPPCSVHLRSGTGRCPEPPSGAGSLAAQSLAAAAGAALLEADALTAWVEALLRESAAADSAYTLDKRAPDPAATAAAQAAALGAMQRTDHAVALVL